MVNCETCRYRIHLANLCDIHVGERDCDKYGTDLCKKMNDPGFVKYMKENNHEQQSTAPGGGEEAPG